MTLLNFPPTNGQPTDGSFTYTANGVIYSWDGEKWTANSEQGLDGNYVNISGDTMTGDLTVPSLNGGPLAGLRNQIINGDFRVWQRGTSFNTTPTQHDYGADRWASSLANAVRIYQRSTNAPDGFAYSARLSLSTSNDSNAIAQAVELPAENSAGAFAVGTQWTISYWTLGTTSTSVSLRFRDGVYSTTGSNTFLDSANPASSTLIEGDGTAGTWNRWQTTITVDSNPGGGTNPDTCIAVVFGFGQSDVRVTGCQLEPGPVATPFEHRPIGLEMSLCQRYFFKTNHAAYASPYSTTVDTSYGLADITFPAEMRDNPTIDNVNYNRATETSAPQATTQRAWFYLLSTSTTGSAGAAVIGGVTFDAEL